MLKQITSSNAATALFGFALASHYRMVGWTNKREFMPAGDFHQPFESNRPCIIALWHGEHFLMPFFGWRADELNILITTHRDGEILARACGHFGLKCIRGSGGQGHEFVRKKAVQAFTSMLRALRNGESIVMTADVPKVARVAGLGIVTLAKYSGRPIIPVAMATSRRHRLSNWDRTCMNLPFGRMSVAHADPIFVPRHADDESLEAARRMVETSLNEATARAYARVDRLPAPGVGAASEVR